MAGDVNQRAIGIAAFRHKGGERALPAAPQQRTGEFGSIKICGGLHGSFPAILLQKGPFLGRGGAFWGTTEQPQHGLPELGPLQPSLPCSVTGDESPLCGGRLECPAVKPLLVSEAGYM